MDCEKFDEHVIDALYDELDELTHAALRRHVEGCSRCADVLAGLRATRDVAMLPLVEPSSDLEERILTAANLAQARAPLHRKLLRGLAWAGSHAMRPQLAMAALFMLVVGSSLLLLRARPGSGVAPVHVTERGTPVYAPELVPTEPEAPAADETSPDRQMRGDQMQEERASARAEAADEEKAGAKDAKKGGGAAEMLTAARDTRKNDGCAKAVSEFDRIGAAYPGTSEGSAAMWEAAACYQSLGETQKARELYLALRSQEGYRDRADAALASTETGLQNNASGPGAGAGVAAPKKMAKSKAEADSVDAAMEEPPSSGAANAAPAPAAPAPPPPGGGSAQGLSAPQQRTTESY